ncbi:hypothetical protein BsWGS_14182 [Bradybaena similaris]
MDRLQGVGQRFRSGSVERDKEPLLLDVPETRSRSYSTNEADKWKQPSPQPSRKTDMENVPSDKNSYRKKPAGTFEYTVQDGDTLVKIGARFEVTPSEMMKINKLLSRTVFVGQTLFIPESKNADSNSSTHRSTHSPLPNSPGDSNLTSSPSLSNHSLHITPPPGPAKETTDEVPDSKPHEMHKSAREHQQKFLRVPVRRLYEEEGKGTSCEACTVKGTLLVTANVIMFDSNVSDPIVISSVDPQKFNAVVYMEEVKSVALYHDLTPKMFWKQPKEIRAHSPKPETYHSGQKTKKLSDETLLEKDEESESTTPATDSVECGRGTKDHRSSPDGGGKDEDEAADNRTSDKPGTMEELSEKLQHRLSASQVDNSDKSSSETHISQSTPTQSFEPVQFTDRSPSSTISHPQAVHGQPMSELSHSPTTAADGDEEILNSNEPLRLTENQTGCSSAKTDLDDSNNVSGLGNSSGAGGGKSPVVRSKSATLVTDSDVPPQMHEQKGGKTPLHATKSASGRNSPKSAKPGLTSMVNKLAFQVSNLSWDPAANQRDGSPKSRESSPRSPSPVRAPGNHLSRFFKNTSNLFQGQDKDVPPDSKDKPSHKLQLKSHFTKEDMSRALGPDPRGFLLRSDSRHFVEPPLYLQVRRGVRKNVEIHQPRAFDHWNTGPILNEYWFVVPRDMGDKLYNFLMTSQPDAYGDEEETQSRGQFFYDADDVESLGTPFIKVTSEDLLLSDDHFKETEKTWEILSKEEVYGTEKHQTMHRQDTFDDSCLPQLIGPSALIKPEYLWTILRSLPASMTVGYNWELVYGTHKHGYSLQNMYMKTELLEEDEPVLLFIMDTYGVVFGAYLSNSIRQSEACYGTGATFLFTFQSEFKKFAWQRSNNFFIHGTKDYLAVGSGEGGFGLWLDDDLDKGRSQQCETFMNDILATEEDFSIVQLEVWKFVDSCSC